MTLSTSFRRLRWLALRDLESRHGIFLGYVRQGLKDINSSFSPE